MQQPKVDNVYPFTVKVFYTVFLFPVPMAGIHASDLFPAKYALSPLQGWGCLGRGRGVL